MAGSGWTTSAVLEPRPDSLTVRPIHWVATTVFMLKMQESDVEEQLQLVPMEPSDFEEALLLKDVWRSALPLFGAQCVMILGIILMPKWFAGS